LSAFKNWGLVNHACPCGSFVKKRKKVWLPEFKAGRAFVCIFLLSSAEIPGIETSLITAVTRITDCG
jgi:hypothetical protein